MSKDTTRMRWSEFYTYRLLAAVRIEITKILLCLQSVCFERNTFNSGLDIIVENCSYLLC
jgi:hypothetical protein